MASRVALLAVAGALALSACSSDDAVAPQAAPSGPAPSSVPSGQPSPSPSGPDRSPEALAAMSKFTAPKFDNLLVSRAVEGYRKYVTQLVVAQGLAEPDYAPLLATIEPRFVDEVLSSTRANIDNGGYLLGTRVETVIDGAGSEGQVFLTSCTDLSDRTAYFLKSNKVGRPPTPEIIPANITMIRAAEGWVISGYVRNQKLVCP